MLRLARALLVAALLVPAAASAETPLLVLYEPGEDDDAAVKRVRTQLRLQMGRFAVKLAEFRPVGTVLDDDLLYVIGPVGLRPCSREGSLPAAAFDGLVGDSAGSLAYLEFDEATATLDEAGAALPCLRDPVDPRTLSRYHLLRGVSAFYAEGPDAARDEFRRGLLVSPFLQWNPDYPPDAAEAFRAAVGDALRTDRGMMMLSPGVFGTGTLWIDGVEVDERLRTRDLFTGAHLLQWRPDDGDGWLTFEGRIDSDATSALAHRDDLLNALVRRRGEPLHLEWLDGRLATTEHEEVLVADADDRLVLFHRFTPDTAAWVDADVTEQELLMARGRRLRGAGIAVGVGGAAVGLLSAGMFAAAGALLRNAFDIGLSVGLGAFSLFVVSTVSLTAGAFVFAGGDQMARGRNRAEFKRYRARVRGKKPLTSDPPEVSD